jgi:hypothetical protein
MKHIVASGCSFTRQAQRINLEGNDSDFLSDWIEMWRWPHWIKNLYDAEVYNMGSATHDNWSIARTTIYKIEKLIESGVNIKDICAIIQWSAWTRESFYVSPSKMQDLNIVIENKTNHSHAHITDWIDSKNYNAEYGYWILTGGFNLDHIENKAKKFLPSYFEYIKSVEQSFINHLEAKLYLENYLKNKGIEWFSFDIQNQFSKSYTVTAGYGFPNYRETENEKFSEAILDRKYIPNTWEDDLNYTHSDNPYIHYLISLVNTNHWFYKEDGITKYGGQIEWAIRNFDLKKEFYLVENINDRGKLMSNLLFMEHCDGKKCITLDDIKNYMDNEWYLGHVSSYMNRRFVNEVLSSFLKKNGINKKLI